MFSSLSPAPADPIISLMAKFAADPRADKIDLGVGVYKDASGKTPIMAAVKTAEKQVWDTQTTKTYTALAGEKDFHNAMRDLVLGDSVPADRIAAAATPGGTGAIHHLFELILRANPDAKLWISNPTWGNHIAIANHVGLPFETYTYFDDKTCTVDFDAMVADLDAIKQGDVVLLHGCCHNPTGANLTQAQWQVVAELLKAKGALAMIDIAYQGFGDGVEEDAFGTRLLAKTLPEMFIAASCSKNFGVYRERVGIVLAITENADTAAIVQGNLGSINRLNFSFPPDHGARLISQVMGDPQLKASWLAELEEVRLTLLDIREKLAAALRQETNSDRFDFIAEHRGMFSRIGITPEQVDQLREDHGIYMVRDSRINIAGVPTDRIEDMAKAIASVIA